MILWWMAAGLGAARHCLLRAMSQPEKLWTLEQLGCLLLLKTVATRVALICQPKALQSPTPRHQLPCQPARQKVLVVPRRLASKSRYAAALDPCIQAELVHVAF